MKKIDRQIDTVPWSRWGYVILGIIIMMCLGTVYSWSVFRLHVEKLYSVGTTESGFPYMISLAFYALFMFLTSKHLEKYRPRNIIIFGSTLVAIGWILSSYAPNIYVLTLTYGVIIGAGVGITYGAPMTVIAKWFPEKKGLAVGLILGGFGLSPLITAPIARYLVELYGITETFKILGIAFGIIIPILSYPLKYPLNSEAKKIKETTGDKVNTDHKNTKEMLKTSSFKGLYFNFIIGSMIGLTLIGMTSNVGSGMIKIPSQTVTLLVSLFAIFNGVSRPIFGWVTDKLSPKKAMRISYSLSIFASVLMLIANEGSLLLFIMAFAIFWFNLGGWLAIAPTSTMNIYGEKYYSENYGVVFTAYGIGAVLGVAISGLLLDILNNYDAIFYFVIILCIIGILLSKKVSRDQ
ncbi:L-lactate MFS transporter [Clostridium cellulovorans]|uniref:Major facilitator superfamily MFS_1 n=1 Tax=Clostridium cellulovorans (strain ATCC 35296 / DSM 3052 / OCM 3 / 743B) TaxID=573061 RepID=D9SVN5_CLOC7|nr:OFA family MFS transporter [Clostridium cellulovorans]ADL53096.1 major facilitator superfamily MFS_1 [Clostridium cellulovorans 743B]